MMKTLINKLAPVMLGSLLVLPMAGCELNDDDDTQSSPDNSQGQQSSSNNFQMQLLHFADIDGQGGAADVRHFSALVDGFRAEYPEKTLLVSSGDNLIPGPEFFAAGDDSMADVLGEPGNGRANIAWLNAMGVQASVVGNHDLDAGTEAFAELIGEEGEWPGAQFPYLAANIDFTADSTTAPLLVDAGQSAQANSVAASATVTVNGETIGLLGASVPTLPSITSTGGLTITPDEFDSSVEADLDALAAELQPKVDELVDAGVNKIVMLAHMQQIDIEKALATRLTDVDIIVAGGSNTLLADGNDTLRAGDTPADHYPLSYSSPQDEPVLVVNTDGDLQYLGRLIVEFDEQGVLQTDALDPAVNGAYATDIVTQPFDPNERVVDITDTLDSVIEAKDGNVLGLTEVYLDGRRSQVRTEETNLGNLTADANLWLAKQEDPSVQVSLKNGGGIRSDIGQALQPPGSNDPSEIEFLPPAENTAIGKPEGAISQLDLETSLRFNNGLTLLTVSAAELADIMEHAFAATEDGATPGQFPQIAGLQATFDPTQAARSANDTNQAEVNINGDRLRELEIVDSNGAVVDDIVTNGVVQGSATREIRLVILDFIAKCVGAVGESCGDAYPLNGLTNPNRVDVSFDPGQQDFADPGSEQDALAEYLNDQFPVSGGTGYNKAETAPGSDTRIVDDSL
ncbi:bifunctional metallophosphatase/5'-nucleotidase [Tamilnaduibacter salinus]|nr:bifunctional metallophosphatase/5'-nucleotidase [Tamilnaduibacter salinus]